MEFNTRKNTKLIIAAIIIGIIILPIFNYSISNRGVSNHVDIVEGKDLDEKEELNKLEETKTAMEKVKETFVFAKIIGDSPCYNNYSNNKEQIGSFKKDEIVEVIRDRSYEWYLVKSRDGREGWVCSTNLIISDDPETNQEQMTKEEIEEFINYRGFKSDTDYLIWVDIDRQLTHVLLKEEDNWKLHRTMLSSTGKNSSPTIKGLYKIQDRGTWFYTERLRSGAKNWVRFNGPYLFHSLAMDKQGNVVDYTLGKRASDGCVRLSLEDSEWFYNNIEENSTVFIN